MLLCLLLFALTLSGCASHSTMVALASKGCTTAWQDTLASLHREGIQDTQSWTIPGYPYLQVNRTLADFDLATLSREQRRDWLGHALANGERSLRARLARLDSRYLAFPEWLMHCAQRQARELADDPARWAALIPAVRVPDAYLDWRRRAGAYPLLRPLLAYQVSQLEHEQGEAFGRPGKLSSKAALLAPPNSPLPQQETGNGPSSSPRQDKLGLPDFTPGQLDSLLAHHAPYLIIPGSQGYDQPGTPVWDGHQWRVKPPATAYTLLSRVRWQGQWLPQLVYVFWFDRRPKPHSLDLYGGRLDGLMWRVTLAPNGQPMLYESVHACGCYLQWYPNPDFLRLNPDAVDDEIMTVFPLTVPKGQPGHWRPVIRLASGTHYVTDVGFTPPATLQPARSRYTLTPYDQLRALPDGSGGHRSLFLANGLVAGTERLERFLLWPTGVLSPGAMRQWGHHATAFVGKRHFDDPDLLMRYFTPPAPAAQDR